MRIALAFNLAVAGMLAIAVQASAAPRVGMGPAPMDQPHTPPAKAAVSDFHPTFGLTAPTQLAQATDPSLCSAHGGFGAGLACKALLPQGRLALIWDYSGGGDVKGFHVYRVDGGQQTLVADQDNGAAVKAYVVDPPPQDGYATACYAVSAYSAVGESALSAPFCGAQARLIQSLTLSPTEAMAVGRQASISSSSPGLNGSGTTTFVDSASMVGFNYTTEKRKALVTVIDFANNSIHRLGLHFDVSPVMHRRIVSASLELEVASAWQGETNLNVPFRTSTDAGDPPTDHQTSCAAKLATGSARWWQYKDWIDASPQAPASAQGPDVSIDATRIVDGWANSALPNFGLVLIGEEENLGAFTEKSCVTSYVPTSIKLVVKYY